MKKTLIVSVILAIILGLGGSAFAAGGNLERAAINAARQYGCVDSPQNLEVQLEVGPICFVEGNLTIAHVYYVPFQCKPNMEPCPRPAVVLVADVTFDCDGNVIKVQCY